MSSFKKGSLKTKTLLVYILIILIPFTVLFAVFTFNAIKGIKDNYVSFMVDKNSRMNQRINDIISDVDRVSYLHIINGEVQDILLKKDRPVGMDYLADVKLMKKLIDTSTALNPLFYEVVYCGNNGMLFSNIPISEETKKRISAWTLGARVLKGKKATTNIYSAPNGEKYVSIYRMLLNSDTFGENGYVFVNINLNTIRANLDRNIVPNSETSDTIIIKDNEVMYHSFSGVEEKNVLNREVIKKIKSSLDESGNYVGAVAICGKKMLLVGTTNEATKLEIIQCMPYSIIDGYSRNSLYFYLCTILPFLAVMNILAYLLTVNIIDPIELLKRAMKKVENGRWVKVEEKIRGEEMRSLICSYNNMVEQLQESIRQKYINEMNQKKMELKMLEAQINPHFLYNTLTMISSIAEIEGIENICTISNSLSDMFRYNILKGSIVKVHEEMEQIRNYVSIQQLRFKEMIDFQYSIDEKIEQYYILKFLIQPIIENAVYHGLEKKSGKNSLRIDFEEANQVLTVIIKDEGVGMSEETLTSLNDRMNQKRGNYFLQDKFEHIGLENVHFRIKDYYGEQYGLQIDSWEGKGTEVKIIIPVVCER